jgi:hypothetical protein
MEFEVQYDISKNLNIKKIKKESNDEGSEFNIQNIELFERKINDYTIISKKSNEILRFNMEQFINEHNIIMNNKNICFIYESKQNKINEYIKILYNNELNNNKIKINSISNNNNDFYYIFIGDVLGNITILQIKNKINKETFNKNIIIEENINVHYKIIKKLNDHNKPIKWIDYNPRLNLLLSYSLDGYINIYVFPKCKLVRAIKVINITKSKVILEMLALISNPFPMIFFYDNNYMYIISINGDFINKKKLDEKKEIYPSIDKNLGLFNDYIYIKNLITNEMIKISLPSLLYEKDNINYQKLKDTDDKYLETLFRVLSYDQILTVYRALLLEKKIYIICYSKIVLFHVCHALLQLLFPIIWINIFIPILPEKLKFLIN